MAKKVSALKEEEKKFKGLIAIFKAIQKLGAKEFVWLLIVLIVSFPLTLLLVLLLDIVDPDLAGQVEASTTIDEVDVFILLYAVCLVGMYFGRILVSSLKTLAKKAEAV